MKNKLQTILLFMGVILFLFISCDNYLVNGGIREYIEGFGASNHTITFDANGGEGTMNPQSVIGDIETNINANTFTHPDPLFKFVGWNTQADGKGTDYADNAPITITKNITLYAKWSNDFWTVTLYGNDGSIPNTDPLETKSTQYVEKTKSTTLANIFERYGYTFNQWTSNQDGTGTEYTNNAVLTPENDIVLYAQWKLAEYTITFLPNSGEGTMTPQIVEHNVKEPLDKNTFMRTDHAFTGWIDADGNTYADEGEVSLTQNITLSAQWKKVVVITFDKNEGDGGLDMAPLLLDGDGEEYIPINTYTRTANAFVGWNTARDGTGIPFADGGLIQGGAISISQSLTLYAQWAQDYFTITYNGNDGHVEGSLGVYTYEQFVKKYERVQLKPKTFVNGNKEFVGWNTQDAGGGTTYQNNETVDAINRDVNLYALWGYTVTFNTDGGSEVPSQLVIEHKTLSAPTSPTKDDYTFAGWYKNAALTDDWDFANDTITADTTLYAKWIPLFNIITFNTNGGEGSMPEQTVAIGIEQTLNKNTTITRSGFIFTGWNDDNGNSYEDGAKITVNENITLYAQWTEALTITFNANTGTGTMEPQIVAKGIDTTIHANTFTPPAGHTFIGWNTQADGNGENYTDKGLININTNTTLYAKWATNVYTITFNANGGRDPVTNEEKSTQSVTIDQTVRLAANTFVREGYRFEGWKTTSNGTTAKYTDREEITPTESIPLYAHWVQEITLTYHINYGSSGLTQTQDVDGGTSLTLQKNNFERERYYFTGWATEINGGGRSYSDEQANVTFNEDTNLYAQWVSAPYSDTLARTIVSNGHSLKLVSDVGGSTVKWLYGSKEIDLQDIHSSNIANAIDLSTYTITNARGEDGNYLASGNHVLTGGSIRGIEGMDTLTIQGDLTIGRGGLGGIILTKDNQLTIAASLTGSDKGIIVRAHSYAQGTEIATVTAGGNPISKLNITDKYGSLPVEASYANGQLIAAGQLGLTPSDRVEWEADGSFTIPEIVLGVEGTIFSLSVADGYFTLGDETSIEGATFNMGIPIISGKPTGYVENIMDAKNYSYIQFFPNGGSTFPAESAASFVQSLTFTPNDSTKEMGVKINLETVDLSRVNTNLNSIDHDKVTYFDGSYYQIKTFSEEHLADAERSWVNAYNSAKDLSFNNLQGYLMTITSKTENNFIFDKVNVNVPHPNRPSGFDTHVRAWIGGTRTRNSDGYDDSSWIVGNSYSTEWYWASGPEAGKTFYHRQSYTNGNIPTGVDYNYNNWNNPTNTYINDVGKEVDAKGAEPNNGDGVEVFAHYLESSLWNDFKLNAGEFAPYHYFVEFSVYGSQKPTDAPAFAEQYYIKP